MSGANADVPAAKKVAWNDLVQGKPELEDSLSANAKAMKADMYTKTFKDATDLDHPCRTDGSTYRDPPETERNQAFSRRRHAA